MGTTKGIKGKVDGLWYTVIYSRKGIEGLNFNPCTGDYFLYNDNTQYSTMS